MSVPRILLLSRTPPGCQLVGSIVLRDMLRMLNGRAVLHGKVGIRGFHDRATTVCFPQPDTYQVEAPIVRYRGSLGSLTARASRTAGWMRAYLYARTNMVRRITAASRSFRPDLVLAILDHSSLYVTARLVAEKLGIPLVTLVWDPPTHFLMMEGADRWCMRRYVTAAESTIKASAVAAVASSRMAADYGARLGVGTVVLIHGYPRQQWIAPHEGSERADKLIIAYSGSLYAMDTWRAFDEALLSCSWQVGGREVIVRMFGEAVPEKRLNPCRYEVFGYHRQQDMLRLLASCDMGYMPYWFDERHRDAVRFSFASKIPSYLAAGLPVFYHGPSESSVADWVSASGAGQCCHSRDRGAVIARLSECAASLCSARPNVTRALEEELGGHVFRSRLAAMLGISDIALEDYVASECYCGEAAHETG